MINIPDIILLVVMWKPLWMLAVLACIFFVKISAGNSVSNHSTSNSHNRRSKASSNRSRTAHTHSDRGGKQVECKCPKPNEEYDVCPVLCPPRECGVNIALILCIVPPKPGDPECEPGCRCSNGFLRNSTGICIPEDKCPKCTKPNEVYDECPAPCPPRRCDVDERLIRCAAPPKPGDPECKPGCRCADGYVRNNDGVCVTRDQCPPTCKKDEVYSVCLRNECEPLKCSEIGTKRACWISRHTPCEGGCICKKGYLRADNGICIPEQDCPPICKENEVSSDCTNGGCNAKNCSQLGKPIPCVKIDPAHCIKGCLCKEGYLRADNGNCVPEDQCPQKCHGANEYYELYPPDCPPQTCESIGKIYHCPLIKTVVKDCKGTCRCIKGFYRNKFGVCISEKDCLKCQGPHEFFSCGGACDNVCALLDTQNQTNCPIVNIKCNEMCYCEEGYARDDKNICIPIEKCPVLCRKPHEIYDPCPNNCPIPKCESIDDTLTCPLLPGGVLQECKGTCVCERGYYRNKMGECHPESDCRKCQGPNEYFSCRGACDNVCSTLNKQNQTNCPIKNKKCNPMCYCDTDYARDDNGICITIKQCGVSCNGDPNAVQGCGNHCGNSCSDHKSKDLVCLEICLEHGCNCKQNYVYDNNIGKCILPKDCTPVCKQNEVYDTCANGGCSKRNCSQIDEPEKCVRPIKCLGGCVCIKGYLRDSSGVCVPIDECPRKCNKANEYYDRCPPVCPPQTCESIGKAISCPAKVYGEHCNGICRCTKGFYRNKIGECISEKDCLKCQGPNEYFSCGGACDNVCATLHQQNQTHCPIVNIVCNPMCYCEEGYARDDYKICVPIEKCLVSCNGDPNAVPGCGNHCGNSCSDHKSKDLVCPEFCLEHGCNCKQNYVYDNNIGKCVLPKDCNPVCKPNEVYDTCANGGCRHRNCSDLGGAILCIDPIKCEGGCICADGYLRDENGICVPKDNCPKPECRKLNEVYDTCANGGCKKRKCSELGDPTICRDPLDCIGDCVCIDGYLRNEVGVCVPEHECPGHCNKPHEVYNPCLSDCPPQTCESIDRAYVCPINLCACNCPANDEHCACNCCVGGCECEDGYYRNLAGECISKKDCLKCKGGHEYYSCRAPCDNVCATLNIQNQTLCPLDSIECKCFCEKGYARDEHGHSILIADCPGSIRVGMCQTGNEK